LQHDSQPPNKQYRNYTYRFVSCSFLPHNIPINKQRVNNNNYNNNVNYDDRLQERNMPLCHEFSSTFVDDPFH
jgi:hypothetical protein